MDEKHKSILKDHGYDWRVADNETCQNVLKNHFRHVILTLSREDVLNNLFYMYENYESIFDDVDMLDLIATMMSTYAETKSMDEADIAGFEIADNSNHGVAKRYVAYLSKEGRDYLWDWNVPELQGADDSIKEIAYDEFCHQFEDELEEHKKSTETNSRRR